MMDKKMRLDLMGTRLSMPELLTITLKFVKLVDSFHKQYEVIGWLIPAHILIDPDEEKALLTEIVRQNEMYCSREKSGRMNHVPDARSDLYALGLILFAGDRRHTLSPTTR